MVQSDISLSSGAYRNSSVEKGWGGGKGRKRDVFSKNLLERMDCKIILAMIITYLLKNGLKS